MSSKSTWKQFPHPAEPSREETAAKEGEKTIPFLRRLIDMLQENEEVISFYPGVHKKNGQATAGRIVVHDRSRVESEILPRYFNHASFASLRRQLNYFCFSRVGKGKQRGATYCNEQVIELHDILRLKRRVAGNVAQIPDSCKESKEEEIAQSIQQPSLQQDATVQSRPQSKSCPSQDVNISTVRKKFHNSSRRNKKRRRILDSIVPVVHLAKRVMVVEEQSCGSKEQTYEDQTTGTVSPPNSVYGNILRTSLESKPSQTLSIAPQRDGPVSSSLNGNFEMFKKRCNSLHGIPPATLIPNFSQSKIPKTALNLSISTKMVRNKEADVLDGCNALLSLGYQLFS